MGVDDITETRESEKVLNQINREMIVIKDCHQIIIRAADEQKLLSDICRIICDQAGYPMAWVGYAENDDETDVSPVAWAGSEDGYLAQTNISWADTKRVNGPIGNVIRSGDSFCSQDFSMDPIFAPWRENALQRDYRSGIFLPLKDDKSNTFGSLNIYSAKTNAFTSDEIRLLKGLAVDLAFGVNVLRTRLERNRAVEALEDVTEQKQVEEKLQMELDWHNAIFEGSRDAILISDSNSMIVDMNEAAVRLTGYSKEELLKMRVSDLNKEADHHMFEELQRRILAGEDVRGEAIIFKKDGCKLKMEFEHHRMIIGGRLYIHNIARNVTAQKQLEAQFLHTQSALAGDIVHDFNNILSVVMGFSLLIQKDAQDNENVQIEVSGILKACERAKNVVKQILTISRQTEGEK